MCWLSMFLGMQTERRLPSSDIVLNYDLHKQAFYMCSTTTTFFFNGNLQMCGELKELLLVSCWAAISLQRSFTAHGVDSPCFFGNTPPHPFGVLMDFGAETAQTLQEELFI